MKLNYGILSTAVIAKRFTEGVRKAGDEVVALASRTLEKAEKRAAELQIERAYGSYEELFKDPDIDVVYIPTNNGTHLQYCKEALRYGKHVVCEKPIALSAQDAKELFAFAKEKQRFLMEAQKSVFLPITRKLQEIMKNKTLGNLHQVEITYSFPYVESAWMHDPTQAGVLYASGNYVIEYLDFLLQPQTWQMQCLGTQEASGAIDCISMNFLMDDILINARITIRGNTHKHAVFYFDQGYVMIPVFWKARKAYIYNQDDVCIETLEFPVDYEMLYEAQHIHSCILQGLLESPVMTSKRSILCCEIVDKLHQQVKEDGNPCVKSSDLFI